MMNHFCKAGESYPPGEIIVAKLQPDPSLEILELLRTISSDIKSISNDIDTIRMRGDS